MPRFILVPAGPTVWEDQRRFEPIGGSPLTDAGAKIAAVTACELVSQDIQALYTCQAEAESETARILAKELGLKVHCNDDLRDLDYGLWQGLTDEEVKRRHPKLHKQWRESPSSVCPPGGETLDDAQRRFARALKTIGKRRKGATVAVVVRPIPASLIRCLAAHAGPDKLWEMFDSTFSWGALDIDVSAIP